MNSLVHQMIPKLCLILTLLIASLASDSPAFQRSTISDSQESSSTFLLTVGLVTDQPASRVFTNSNLKRIPIKIVISDSPALLLSTHYTNNDAHFFFETNQTTFSVDVRSATNQDVPRVSALLTPTGYGKDMTDQYVNLDIELPIPRVERDQQIASYLKGLETPTNSNGTKNDPELIRLLSERRLQVRQALEKIFVQNRTGDFWITASLKFKDKHGSSLTNWASRILVQVVDEGNFLSQGQFK